MSIEEFAAWLFIGIACVSGLGLLFVRIDAEQLSHSLPGLALFRFPLYRYGTASVCFALAVVAYLAWLR